MKRTLLNIVLVAIQLCFCLEGYSQKTRTMAGNNMLGYSGDGGAAVNAMIGKSWGVVTDTRGNLFVADDDMNVIRKIKPDGTISTFAGTGRNGYTGDGGAATAAKLNYPSGMAVDIYGNLYVADNGNFAIRKIDTAGIITTVVGDGTGIRGNSGDGGPAWNARLEGCVSLAFDNHNNMYIADGNTKIRKVNSAGMISTVAGTSMYGYSGDGGSALSAALAGPCGVAVDAIGNIYITDQLNNVIRKVNTAGIISTIAGNTIAGFSGDGAAAGSAKINTPAGIIVDNNGNIYFADEGNNRVREINAAGIISTIAGNGSGGYYGDGGEAIYCSMNGPSALCLNNSGNLFIADRNNYVVREVVNQDTLNIIANPGNVITTGRTVTFSVPAHANDYGLLYQWQVNGTDAGTNSETFTSSTIHNGDIITCKLVDPGFSSLLKVSDNVTMIVNPLTAPFMIANKVTIGISLFPNPNNGNFEFTATINSLIDEYVYYGVYDIAGRLLYSDSGYAIDRKFTRNVNIDNTLPPGQYSLFVSSADAKSMVHFEINQ